LRELNERLATPPMVDVAVSRMMGLVVVARLAARHGVGVELRAAADRGTVAEVTLPISVLVSRALAGRTRQPAVAPAAAAPQPPQQRAPLAAPLALESGPGGRAEPPGLGPAFGARPFDPAPVNGGGGAPGFPVRPLPPWADLTGAGQGGNGGGPFTPRPTTPPSAEPLPQRRATEHEPVEGGATSPASGPLIPRQLPASPEAQRPVNGATGGSPMTGAPDPGMPLPLPPPRSGPRGPGPSSGPPTPDAPASAPPAPEPPMSGPPSPPAAPPAMSGPPTASAAPPTSSGPPVSGGPLAPPAWPPAAVPGPDPATSAEADRDTPPPVPENLAAALDMTAELPTVVRRSPETAPPPPAPETRPRFMDETMELPIFRELESAWFRTRRSMPEQFVAAPPPASGVADPGSERFARADAGRGAATASQDTPTGSSAMVNKPTPGDWATGPSGAGASGSGSSVVRGEPVVTEWTTVADEGWRAASAAAEPEPSDTTEAGLPKRVPMAQLVPGGVDKPATSAQRRTPESVRGLLSAYHRGVQRGRTHSKDDNATSPGAPPTGPSQTGPAPGAESGQKEQN
jgi:hypothetical protein